MRSTFHNFIDYINICTSYKKRQKKTKRFKILRTNFNEHFKILDNVFFWLSIAGFNNFKGHFCFQPLENSFS